MAGELLCVFYSAGGLVCHHQHYDISYRQVSLESHDVKAQVH